MLLSLETLKRMLIVSNLNVTLWSTHEFSVAHHYQYPVSAIAVEKLVTVTKNSYYFRSGVEKSIIRF